jgi:hypothetical protein
MADPLNKHVRREHMPLKVTSINLEPKHIKFIRDNRVNLSSLVRELIDKLINRK